MKSDAKIFNTLNEALGNELIAINQYFLHARMFKDWGFHSLDKQDYKRSINAMNHADKLVERILFLEGLPNLQDLGKLLLGENTKEMLECDLKLEMNSTTALREGIAYCESTKDYVSRDLLESVLNEGEKHIDWLETQLGLIDKVGLENYLQSSI